MNQALVTETGRVCSACGSVIAPHSGFVVCESCGLTHDREYVNGTFELDGITDHRRPASRHVSIGSLPSIATCLGSDLGYYGRPETKGIKNRVQILKLRTLQSRERLGNDRLRKSLMSLRSVCSSLELSNIVQERAAYLMKKAKAKGFRMYYTTLAARCLLIATKENRSPVTDKEVIHEWKKRHPSITIHNLNQTAFWMQENLGIRTQLKRPIDYLPRVISSLRNDQRIIDRIREKGIDGNTFFNLLATSAKTILLSRSFLDYGSHSRYALATSLCYLIARAEWGVLLTQRLTACACGVMEYTLRDHYRLWKRILT